MKTSEQQNPSTEAEVGRAQRDLLAHLMVFAALLVLTSVIAVNNNGARPLPVYLFLLLLGAGLGLQLNLSGSLVVAVVAMVTWIGAERSMGTWTRPEMLNNLFELLGLSLVTLSASLFHGRLKGYLQRYAEAQHHLDQLEIEDKQIGLLRPPIGRLRLGEEVERAFQQQASIALILLSVQPIPEKPWGEEIRNPILQAVATLVKDTARDVDVPFSLENDRIALVVPAAGITETQKTLDYLARRLQEGRYLLPNGQTSPLDKQVQVRYGFAVFLGEAEEPPDLLEAAERSLAENIEANAGLAFQNLFISWVTVGQRPTTSLEGHGVIIE